MRRIYCFVNARGQGGRTDVLVEALCEDGDFLASHRSSDESLARYDIGVTSGRQHAAYEDHCPEGYTLEWVDRPLGHDDLAAAYRNHCRLPRMSATGARPRLLGPVSSGEPLRPSLPNSSIP